MFSAGMSQFMKAEELVFLNRGDKALVYNDSDDTPEITARGFNRVLLIPLKQVSTPGWGSRKLVVGRRRGV